MAFPPGPSLVVKIIGIVLFAGVIAGIAYGLGSSTMHPETHDQNMPLPSAAVPNLPPISDLLAKADSAAGEKSAEVCAVCHSFGKGEPARMGPNLYGIVGAKHAHMPGYDYSDAMKALADKSWTTEELNIYLYNPRASVRGTRMSFAGIKNDSDRANVIAWLQTLSDHPQPTPAK